MLKSRSNSAILIEPEYITLHTREFSFTFQNIWEFFKWENVTFSNIELDLGEQHNGFITVPDMIILTNVSFQNVSYAAPGTLFLIQAMGPIDWDGIYFKDFKNLEHHWTSIISLDIDYSAHVFKFSPQTLIKFKNVNYLRGDNVFEFFYLSNGEDIFTIVTHRSICKILWFFFLRF